MNNMICFVTVSNMLQAGEGDRTSQAGSRVLTEPVVIWGIGMATALNRAVRVSPREETEV